MLRRTLNVLLVVWLSVREVGLMIGGKYDPGRWQILRGHLAVAVGIVVVSVGQIWLVVWLLQATIDVHSAPVVLRAVASHSIAQVVLVIALSPVALVVAIILGLYAISWSAR